VVVTKDDSGQAQKQLPQQHQRHSTHRLRYPAHQLGSWLIRPTGTTPVELEALTRDGMRNKRRKFFSYGSAIVQLTPAVAPNDLANQLVDG
jgi:hypothetical protein